jgi:hypothetical protein
MKKEENIPRPEDGIFFSSEVLVAVYIYTGRHNPEDRFEQSHRKIVLMYVLEEWVVNGGKRRQSIERSEVRV